MDLLLRTSNLLWRMAWKNGIERDIGLGIRLEMGFFSKGS